MNMRPGRGSAQRGAEEARAWLAANRGGFEDWPKINALPDQFGFRVRGKVIRPNSTFLPKLIGGTLGTIIAIAGGVAGLFIGARLFGIAEPGFWVIGGLVVALGATLRWIRNVMREWGGSGVDVIITPQRIGVGRLLGYEWVERRFGTAFHIERPHSKTYEDEDEDTGIKIDRKERENFANSDEVILMAGVRRVVVAEIFNDKRRTEKLHMTLFVLNNAVS